ncbi:Predicted glycosyltransferase [Phaffia rhodozyma]|uniref:UDP-N-acetylglucosamine transferase subunit ALG13 n=1 Tax=Phaffia rhodozyma TaxID=264483 RepID=A0A0F7SIS2_PHARH|nr:Predicted glycosyltransferase [Phaffia rhodozyma]
MDSDREQICFVTVGSTSFTALISHVLSIDSLAALTTQGFRKLIVQYGNSDLPPRWVAGTQNIHTTDERTIEVELWKFRDRVEDIVDQADLVISHAGAGSILTSLRQKKTLIVVVNLSLMDNHQAELAKTLSSKSYLLVATPESLSSVISTLSTAAPKLVSFPAPDSTRFLDVINEELNLV